MLARGSLLGVRALAVAAVLAVCPPVDAQTGLALAWTAPEGCPSQAEVEAEVDRLLGGPASSRSQRRFRVRASVTREAAWQVVLDTSSDESNGHRTLEAASCEGLANATALIVALMIDPSAATAPREPPKPESRARPATDVAAPPPPTPAPATVQRPGRASTLLIGAVASGNAGVLPSPDLEVAGAAGIVGQHWRLELRGAYGPRQVKSDTLATTPGAHGEFQAMFLGTLTGCLTTSPARTELGACLSVEGGVIHGRGVGASTTEERSQPWFGVGAGAFYALRAGRHLAFPVHVDAVVPIWRPTYVFTHEPSPIFRPWPVGGRLTVSAEWRF
jgi:hypothetical protein